jgi:hypothetical protein
MRTLPQGASSQTPEFHTCWRHRPLSSALFLVHNRRHLIWTTLALVILCRSAIGGTLHPRSLTAHVKFLATSTCIRGTWDNNEDICSAEFVPNAKAAPVHLQLVDEYPFFTAALSQEELNSTAGSTLRIRRDTQCNLPYAKPQLRNAPGDQREILSPGLNYSQQFVESPTPDEIPPFDRTLWPKSTFCRLGGNA